MIQTAERPHVSPARVAMAIFAALALALSLVGLARPALAHHVDGATVQLNQDLNGGVSSDNPGEFAGSEDECADVEDGTVLFHFVANQITDGTTSGTLTATFEGMGDVTVDGYFPSGKDSGPVMHFDVVLDASATLTGAYATFNQDQDEDTNLLLSHVCDRTGGGTETEQGTLVINKWFCEADAARTTFYTDADTPDLSACYMGDAQFTLDGGAPFGTTDGTVSADLDAGTYTLAEVSSGASTSVDITAGETTTINVVNNEVAGGGEVGQGTLEVEKYVCPTDGETRTEFDVFGPAEPMLQAQSADAECSVGADVAFTVWADGSQVAGATTNEDGVFEIKLDAGDYTIREESSGATADFSIAEDGITAIVVTNYLAAEVQNGTLEVEKFFCPTDGETRTEFDVFGPAEPQAGVQSQDESCSIGADVTFTIWQGETQVGDALLTDENGTVQVDLAPGEYTIREEASGATADFTIGEAQITAIVVTNYVAAPQGQVKVLKYQCEADQEGVEFYLAGEAPNLENCDPADASFTLDGGDAWSTTNGIAIVWADEGTHTLAEVGTDASTQVDVTANSITTVIVLNNVESAVEGGTGSNTNGGSSQAPGGEGAVMGGQGGPGSGLPDTAVQVRDSANPAIPLGALALVGLGGLGALNMRTVRNRRGR